MRHRRLFLEVLTATAAFAACLALYEASFVVLDGDPTRSVDNLFRITTRVKQGMVLPSATETTLAK